jgi:hypothetical protein
MSSASKSLQKYKAKERKRLRKEENYAKWKEDKKKREESKTKK